jgi:polygalacturonase
LHDVKILGNASASSTRPPKIDGVGLAWEVANAAKLLKAQRPHALEFARVTNVEVAFVTIEESAYWSFHLSQCTNVWVHDATILATTPNGDGVDIGAENAVLERMHIDTADDAIAIKSGDAPAGSGFPPSRNITIRDSTLASGEGCIAIGSEMTAGVEDVEVSNITCQAAGHALLYVKERRAGGGYVRNVVVRDSVVTGPVKRFLWLSQHFGEGGENAERGEGAAPSLLPFLSNITLRDIAITGLGVAEQAALLNGATSPSTLPGGQGAIVGVVLENLDLGKPLAGWTCANATGVWRNVTPPPCSELTPQ